MLVDNFREEAYVVGYIMGREEQVKKPWGLDRACRIPVCSLLVFFCWGHAQVGGWGGGGGGGHWASVCGQHDATYAMHDGCMLQAATDLQVKFMTSTWTIGEKEYTANVPDPRVPDSTYAAVIVKYDHKGDVLFSTYGRAESSTLTTNSVPKIDSVDKPMHARTKRACTLSGARACTHMKHTLCMHGSRMCARPHVHTHSARTH